MEFQDFNGVEIFRAGKWTDSKGNTRSWTIKDLDGIVQAHKETIEDVKVPLKIGHNEEQKLKDDEEPAFGWVENLKRVGNRLVGDFKSVPDTLAKLIEKGAYRARSAELFPNFEVGEKKYSWLLGGVALLGGKLPAVSGLKDILALYEREGVEYDDKSSVIFFESEGADNDDIEEILEALKERLSRYKGKRGVSQVRALQSALTNAISSVKGRSNNEVDASKLAKLLGLKDDATEEEIEHAISALNKKEHSGDDDSTSEHAKENTELKNRILELEKRDALHAAESIVDAAIKAGKILPKQREFALSYAQRDAEGFNKFVETQPNMVEFGERGTSKNNEINFGKYEPTADEIVVAKQMNVYTPQWRVALMRQKAEADGVTLPADFEKKSE